MTAEELTAVFTGVLAVVSVGTLFGLLWHRRLDVQMREEERLLDHLAKMRDEYGTSGIALRRAFGTGLEAAFERYRNGLVIKYDSVKDLAEAAGCPPDLIGCPNIKNWDPEHLNEGQAAAFRFARYVYPSDVSHKGAGGKSDREFEDARSRLGDFWERWCDRLPLDPLATAYRKERHNLLWLSWLDPAHRKRIGEDDEGKQSLYRLAALIDEQAREADS